MSTAYSWVTAFYHLAAPPRCYQLIGVLLPWLGGGAALFFIVGCVWGLVFSPPDYQQGDSVRIMYVHVPAAMGSMAVYVLMALMGAIGLIWHIKIADMMARSCAPVGAAFTVLALVTGSLWGKPTWGTYWVWDARLTSELILLFLYMGYIAVQNAIEDRDKAAHAGALIALVGLVNIPIIHYSVEWWNTLHQGTSLFKLKPSLDSRLLMPLVVMLVAYALIAWTLILIGTRNEILLRRRQSIPVQPWKKST